MAVKVNYASWWRKWSRGLGVIFGAKFEVSLYLIIDLFSLYILFSHFRPRDATRGNSFFQMSSYARANLRITNEKTKGKFPWGHHVVWNGKTKCTSWKGLLANVLMIKCAVWTKLIHFRILRFPFSYVLFSLIVEMASYCKKQMDSTLLNYM